MTLEEKNYFLSELDKSNQKFINKFQSQIQGLQNENLKKSLEQEIVVLEEFKKELAQEEKFDFDTFMRSLNSFQVNFEERLKLQNVANETDKKTIFELQKGFNSELNDFIKEQKTAQTQTQGFQKDLQDFTKAIEKKQIEAPSERSDKLDSIFQKFGDRLDKSFNVSRFKEFSEVLDKTKSEKGLSKQKEKAEQQLTTLKEKLAGVEKGEIPLSEERQKKLKKEIEILEQDNAYIENRLKEKQKYDKEKQDLHGKLTKIETALQEETNDFERERLKQEKEDFQNQIKLIEKQKRKEKIENVEKKAQGFLKSINLSEIFDTYSKMKNFGKGIFSFGKGVANFFNGKKTEKQTSYGQILSQPNTFSPTQQNKINAKVQPNLSSVVKSQAKSEKEEMLEIQQIEEEDFREETKEYREKHISLLEKILEAMDEMAKGFEELMGESGFNLPFFMRGKNKGKKGKKGKTKIGKGKASKLGKIGKYVGGGLASVLGANALFSKFGNKSTETKIEKEAIKKEKLTPDTKTIKESKEAVKDIKETTKETKKALNIAKKGSKAFLKSFGKVGPQGIVMALLDVGMSAGDEEFVRDVFGKKEGQKLEGKEKTSAGIGSAIGGIPDMVSKLIFDYELGLTETIAKGMNDGINTLKENVPVIGDYLATNMDVMGETLGGIGKGLNNVLEGSIDMVMEEGSKFLDQSVKSVTKIAEGNIFEGLSGLGKGVGEFYLEMAKQTGENLYEIGTETAKGLIDSGQAAVSGIVGFFDEETGKMLSEGKASDWVVEKVKAFPDTISTLIDETGKAISETVGSVQSSIGNIYDTISNEINLMIDDFPTWIEEKIDILKGAFDSIINFFQDTIGGILDFGGEIVGGVKDTANEVVNNIGDTANEIGSTLGGAWDYLFNDEEETNKNENNVQKFETGGLVDTVPAKLTVGEGVVPLKGMSAIGDFLSNPIESMSKYLNFKEPLSELKESLKSFVPNFNALLEENDISRAGKEELISAIQKITSTQPSNINNINNQQGQMNSDNIPTNSLKNLEVSELAAIQGIY